MAHYTLLVAEEFHGRTLLDFLNASLQDLLKGTLERLIKEGCVTVEGRRLKADWRLLKGLEVRVEIPEGFTIPASPRALPLQVLMEDDRLVAVNKDAGVSTTPGWGQDGPSLLEGVWHHLAAEKVKPRIVNRLDKETSGVLLFAKDDESHSRLSSQFEQRTVEKVYLALVTGEPAEDSGEIDLPISPHPKKPSRMLVSQKDGKEAMTRWRVAERFEGYTLLEVHPRTGRTHQIRVHMAAIGHPLAIDPLYGEKRPILLSAFKPGYRRREEREERPLIGRLTLHAASLTFRHPTDARVVTLEAPLPKDFRGVLRALRRHRLPLGVGVGR